jgi:hypothetical protein
MQLYQVSNSICLFQLIHNQYVFNGLTKIQSGSYLITQNLSNEMYAQLVAKQKTIGKKYPT